MNPGEICGCPYELSCIRQYQASSFPSQLFNLYIDGINLSECIPEGSAACLESLLLPAPGMQRAMSAM